MRFQYENSLRWLRPAAWLVWLALLGTNVVTATEVRNIDAQGHRGARGLAPENSLPAFATALGIGVTTLEMDLGMTGDGVVVVHHDARLNRDITRTSDGKWLATPGATLNERTFSELRQLDVGRIDPASDYAAKFPHQRAVDGTRIPSLAEVVALTRRAGNDVVRFNLEVKTDPRQSGLTRDPDELTDAVVAVLRDEGVASRTTIQSFDWRVPRRVQAMAPDIATAYLTVQQSWYDNIHAGKPMLSPWTAGFDVADFGGSVPRMVNAAGGTVWSPYFRELDARALAEAHSLGLRVVVWTVNNGNTMRRLIRMGVDGIITDYPDRLRDVMRDLELPLPEPTPIDPQ